MSEYKTTKLFLAAVEQEAAQAELLRALRRKYRPAPVAELGRLMLKRDLLTEEIGRIEGAAR